MILSPGTRLGKYEILGPLGEGGMGEVYRAKDLRLGRDVAVKVLPKAVESSPDRLARFEREARTVAALYHPNIVTLFSIEQEAGVRFLTMELIEGETLDRLVPPEGLPLSRILELAIPLADALIAAHERGVIHRDLKPGNVMVTQDARVKVLDFGLAKIMAGDSEEQRWSHVRILQSPTRATFSGRCRTWRRPRLRATGEGVRRIPPLVGDIRSNAGGHLRGAGRHCAERSAGAAKHAAGRGTRLRRTEAGEVGGGERGERPRHRSRGVPALSPGPAPHRPLDS